MNEAVARERTASANLSLVVFCIKVNMFVFFPIAFRVIAGALSLQEAPELEWRNRVGWEPWIHVVNVVVILVEVGAFSIHAVECLGEVFTVPSFVDPGFYCSQLANDHIQIMFCLFVLRSWCC
jgi:hypothetical protein